MQRKIHWILLVVLAVIGIGSATVLAQPPEILWTRTYGGSGTEAYFGADVHQTSDGGYIIAGSTSSYGAGGHDAWVIKTDANGNSLWSHTFGGSGSDYACNVQQTTDGGYIIGGCYNWSYYSGDLWLIKLDPNGTEVWNRTFHRGGSNVGDHGGFVQQTSDGWYILFGHSGSYYVARQYDWWLIKTDANGDSLWSRTYGGEGTEWAETVHQTQDGGYILSGATNSFPFTPPPNMAHYWLLKTDANGDSLWSHLYTNEGYDIGRGSQQTSDGGYVFVGATGPLPPSPQDMWLIKTDVNGDIEWDRTFGGSGDDYGYKVLQTEDGGYVVVGTTSSYGAGGYDTWLIKTDAIGDSLWSRTAGGSGTEWGFGIDLTGDGGYVAVGSTNSFGAGGDDLYLVRLAAEQPPPDVTITLVPFVYPLQIPASGGSFEFYVFVTNSGSDTAWVDLWTKAILPNGAVVGPLLGPASVALDSGVTGWVRSQNVPGRVPSGLYTYIACAGDYPGSIWASDSLQFTKLATGDGGGVSDWANWGDPLIEQPDAPDNHPATFVLHRPAPNPFNPATTIAYSLPEAASVQLQIFDVSGRGVAALADGWQDAGEHSVVFDASGLPSGIYFARLSVNGFDQTQKLLLLK